MADDTAEPGGNVRTGTGEHPPGSRDVVRADQRGRVEWRRRRFGRFAARYAIAGDGPALILPKKDLASYVPFHTMTDRYTVVQIEPLGFCHSDRADRYEISVADQILAICDGEGIDRFAVWGYSQGGAMACTVARASPRVRALVCGGYNVFGEPGAAWLTRANRQRRIPESALAFWNDFSSFDWHAELRRLDIPALMYCGSDDPHRLRRQDLPVLRALGVDVVQFDGYGHAELGLTTARSPALATVASWLDQQCVPAVPERTQSWT